MIPAALQTTSGVIPIIVIGGYLFLLLFLGWLGHRVSTGSEEDYYLAGRRQNWLISSLTIIATFLSSFALLGAPGMVYREGVVFALVSLNVPIAGFCIGMLGPRIWKLGRDGHYVTQADMICDHYKSRISLRLLVTLVGVLFVVPYVIMQIKAGGDLAAVLFPDSDSSFEIGAIILASITAIYIMVGGMRSVAWTDAIQCVLLIAGMILAAIAMVAALGGPTQFLQKVQTLPKSSLTVPGNTGQWQIPFLFSVCLLMPIGGIIQPAQWMRFYAASGPQALRRSSLIFIVLLTACFLFTIMPVGLGGQILYPLEISETGVSPHPEVGTYDQILIFIARHKMPELFGASLGEFIATMLVVAIMAASMSTADSNLHALSALLTRDIYSQFVRPKASESEKLWAGRFFIIAATSLSLGVVLVGQREASSLADFLQMIVGLALFAVAFSVQLLPITIDILYVRKGTKWGAVIGLAVGLLTAFCFTSLFPSLLAVIPELGLTTFLTDSVHDLKTLIPIHASAWGLIPNIVLFVIVSCIESAFRKES